MLQGYVGVEGHLAICGGISGITTDVQEYVDCSASRTR